MAGTGGKRAGAGRPPGSKSKKTKDLIKKLKDEDVDPLGAIAYVLKRAKEEGDMPLMLNAAKELAQYVAPKLKSIEHTGKDGEAIKTDNILTVTFVEPKVFED